MPGVQRFFSKSVPAVTVEGSTPGCAPTRTTISFDALPNQPRDIEDRGGEAGQVLADLSAVQPDGGAELRLVDAQDRDAAQRGHVETAAIPEPVALLARDAGIGNQRRCGRETTRDTILNQLAALELVHVLEGGDGRVGESGDRRAVGVGRRQGARLDGIGDVPLPVQRQRGPWSGPERGGGKTTRNKGTMTPNAVTDRMRYE